MTGPVQTGASAFLARYEALRGRLPGDSALRAAAADAFRAAGLPGATQQRRVEAWKYTSLRPLADTTFRTPVDQPTDLARLPHVEAPRIVFVDGSFAAEMSDSPSGFA